MKKSIWTLLTLLTAIPAAAQDVAVGDLAGFKEALKGVQAPAVVATNPVKALPGTPRRIGSCVVRDVDGATISRGLLDDRVYKVKIEPYDFAKVVVNGDTLSYIAGETFFDPGCLQARATLAWSGSIRTATVVDRSGKVIGSIIEETGSDSSRFTITDASGRELAKSGDVGSTSWTMSGAGVSVSIRDAHWIEERYSISMTGVDGRLVLLAAILNGQAMMRRALVLPQ